MNAKHTPGPWELVPRLSGSENHKGFFIRTTMRDGGWALAEVHPGDEDGNLGEANARLIAVAPRLLKALIVAEAFISFAVPRYKRDRDEAVDEVLPQIRAALADAGEPV